MESDGRGFNKVTNEKLLVIYIRKEIDSLSKFKIGGIMWKNEFRRNFCSIKTLIVLVLLISIGIMNIKYQYNNHIDFIDTYNGHYEDINNEGMLELINGYNGMKVGIQFLVTSEFIEMYAIILFLFVRNIYFI